MERLLGLTIISAGIQLLVLRGTTSAAAWDEKNNGLVGGDVRALVASSATPSTFYAGTCTGVFKSTDAGTSWMTISQGSSVRDLTSLVVNSIDSDTIYAGTEDGLFKTTDGGASWADISFAIPNRSIITLALDSQSPDTVYLSLGGAAQVGRVFKTVNGGESWDSTFLGGDLAVTVVSIAVDPNDASVVYAGAGAAQLGHGVYKSEDGGSSWTVMSSGLLGTVWVVVADPLSSSAAYASTNEGVFKTTDGSASWSQILGDGNFGSFLALAVAPTDPNTIYTGGDEIPNFLRTYGTTDGGGTWASLERTPAFNVAQTVAIDSADPTSALFGFQGTGVYQVDPSGSALVPSSQGLTGTTVALLASGVSSLSGGTVFYAGSLGNGIYLTVDYGETWGSVNNGLGDSLKVRALAVAPEAAETAYLATWGGLFRTTDAGANWSFLPITPNPEITQMDAVAVHPVDLSTVYASGRTPSNSDQGIFKSLDGGDSWVRLSYPFAVSFLAVNPTAPETIYAINVVGFLYKSTDGGDTWAFANISTGGAGYAINVVFDPSDANVVYFAFGSAIFRTTDGARTWTRLTGAPSGNITALIVDPNSSSILYAAYQRSFNPNVFGIYKSTNRGASWVHAQDGITSRDASALTIDPQNSEVVLAGTKCSGTFLTTTGGL